MAGNGLNVTGLALPPKVEGKVNGHLVMKVDEVLWARKPPGEVSAVVMWWGAEEPATFRPTDVSEDAIVRKKAGIIYEIRTSLVLFEKYLRKCGSLEIAMADKYGMPIGCASVTNLHQMISSSPYQGYYPIVNNFGNRIGDLHVSFNLRMVGSGDHNTATNKSNTQGIKIREPCSPTRNNPPPATSATKEEKTKKNEEVIKDGLTSRKVVANPSVPNIRSLHSDSNDYMINVVSQESVASRVSPTSNKISQILKHGTRLRDAMTASVMEDGLHSDLKNIPLQNILGSGSEVLSDGLPLADSFPLFARDAYHKVSQACHNQYERKTPSVVQKKVLDYLSGKPMSQMEEEEALAALRSLTPTKDILCNVVPDTLLESEPKESLIRGTNLESSSEIVTNETGYKENNPSSKEVPCSFEVDSHFLSQINCLRITVKTLLLNSVGIKRVGSCTKKKGSLSNSNMTVHPPGVTYFVEYKFPLVAGSRHWESDVRYCSKRFNDHEVKFGDRTIHNLPDTWRCSISEDTNLDTLISGLTFKVCARHLHQRVPISLGSASPESAQKILESAHLRHDFHLPVIASDRLPVAQLKLCLELGRDRIHFGGIFDPENNSLGIKSPRSISSATKKKQPALVSKKKEGKSITTVTRNVSSKLTPSPYKIKTEKQPLKAKQADRVIKQLVADASDALKSSCSSSTSSVLSVRPKLKPSNSNVPMRDQVSAFLPSGKPSFEKAHFYASVNEQFLKHELAVTLLQVIGLDCLTTSVADDSAFYVTYKFPVINFMKNDSVYWSSSTTEPSEGTDGTWQRAQNKVHSIVLPKTKSLHAFLQYAFQFQGGPRKACVQFALYVRRYGTQVQDSLVAEASLPIKSMLTLEDAYNEASNCNPNFSNTSCSSVLLELPFEFPCQTATKNACRLRLKLDYRHSFIKKPVQKENLPRSRGDSITENLPSYSVGRTRGMKLNLEGELGFAHPVNSSNWTKTSDKSSPTFLNLRETFPLGGTVNQDFHFNTDFNQNAGDLHASWEPVVEKTFEFQSPHSKVQDSAYQLSSPCRSEVSKRIVDVIHISQGMSLSGLQSNCQSVCEISPSHHQKTPENERTNTEAPKKGLDAATSTSPLVRQRHTSSRATSPMSLVECDNGKVRSQHKATSTEQIPDQEDRCQQASVENASRESQTTPRESKEIPRRDVGTSVSGTELQLENEQRTELTASVFPHSSIDDVETKESSQFDDRRTFDTVMLNEEDSFDVSSEETMSEEVVCLTNTANYEKSTFRAKIGVERALHLQTRDQQKSHVFVSVNPCGVDGHVSEHLGLSPVLISPAVSNNGEPEWHWQTEVPLPTDLLVSSAKRLIFKIWLCERAPQDERLFDNGSANLIGFSALDLTVLSAGLPVISGWYNVMDFSGACQGQIKLSVEPQECVSKMVNLSSLPAAHVAQSDVPLSVFVAHCAYPDFPSHVTQFADMRVKKLDPQASNQAMSAFLSNYQLGHQGVRAHCEPFLNLRELRNDKEKHKKHSTLPLQRTEGSAALESPPSSARPNYKVTSETASTPALLQHSEICSSELVLAVEKDPSIRLREKLSELDKMTKTIKARLLTRESVHSSRTPVPPNEAVTSSDTVPLPDRHNIGQGDEVVETSKDSCNNCACGSSTKSAVRNEAQAKPGETSIGHPSEVTSGNEQRKASQKQRKTWERQEDLIDFTTLTIEDECEQSPQPEDLSDWLTESALQQVFNPFLFNDILNSMNSSRGVQVIELDDTETSDDNHESHRSGSSPVLEQGKDVPQKSCKRRHKRGNETYRKEMPHFSPNPCASQPHSRSGPACDADSGVDVDLSANFHPGAFFGASGTHHEPRFTRHRHTGVGCAASIEREESSSCSLSSPRNQQSTLASSTSTSATPSDSPQHTQAFSGCQNKACPTKGASEKQCFQPTTNLSRRN